MLFTVFGNSSLVDITEFDCFVTVFIICMHSMFLVANNTIISPTSTATQDNGGAGTQAQRLNQLNSLIHDEALAKNCSSRYEIMHTSNERKQWYLYILDFVQGTVSWHVQCQVTYFN